MQLQSLQSYHNKAVPSAALLFVYVDRAHTLPVSPLEFYYSEISLNVRVTSQYCLRVIDQFGKHILLNRSSTGIKWEAPSVS